MSFDQTKFIKLIPDSFRDVYAVINSFGFTPVLVGGSVRDFFLLGTVGSDWDIELTHGTNAFNKETWKDLGHQLSKLGKVSFLPYEVIRLDKKDIQFEFSPPRLETFGDDWDNAGHSNFTAEFEFKIPFNQAVKRRDFTINAMGIKFLSLQSIELMDPLGGLVHLRDKLLHPCSADFKKDPIRFLRSIRFSLKMGFSFTPELNQVLKTMPVSGISPNYLWSEMQKSKAPLIFLKRLLDWHEIQPQLKLPLDYESMNQRWDELERVLHDPTKHETWVIALEWVGIPSLSWQNYFSISSETCNRMGRWAQNTKDFSRIRPEEFHGDFDSVRLKPDFEKLFDWYFSTKQLLQKNPSLPLLKMIEDYLPDWIHLYRFEALKDVKHIDPPLRAKYQVWNLCQRL